MKPTKTEPKTDKNHLSTLSEQTRFFVTESISESTRRAYTNDLTIFARWCQAKQIDPIHCDAGVIANFLADQASKGISPSTLNRRIAAIKYAHEARGFQSPTLDKLVSSTLKGIKRNRQQPPRQKQAATAEKIITMLAHCDTTTLIGKRDKALLLIGFAGAFRRSELGALTVDDVFVTDEGLRVNVRQSKTDQEAQGQQIAIPDGKMQVVDVLFDWLDHAGIFEGYVFRGFYKGGKTTRTNKLSGQAVADIVKTYALKSGFNPAEFAGHSLRSGFVTSAAENGANLFKIMDVSRHKSVQTIREYVRHAEAFKDHAGSAFL